MAVNGKNPRDYASPPPRKAGLYYDPLHGYIPIQPLIRRAFDLPTLQRLRRIRQLSTLDLVFPGATHTRFAHSVGVFHLASTVYQQLFFEGMNEERCDWPELSPIHRMALELAALFHDVGHGPYSHVFEIFCERNINFQTLKHEGMTERLISQGIGSYSDIPRFLTDLQTRLQEQKDVNFLSPHNIACISVGKPPPVDKRYAFLSEIISNLVVDVDRMDYLRRDAYYTGVEVPVDIWQLIHGFQIEEDKKSGTWNLRMSSDASDAVELLLATRDITYRKVYYHRIHRAAQEMMIQALYEISSKYPNEELALFTDDELINAFLQGNSFTKDVASRIRQRQVYRPLPFEINVFSDLDDSAKKKLKIRQKPLTRQELQETVNTCKEIAESLTFPEDMRIIFDIQSMPLSKKEAYEHKFFYDDTEKKSKSLLEVNPHLELTHGAHEQYVQQVSKLLILIPYEYLDNCLKDLDCRIGAGNTKENYINAIYEQKLKPIITRYIAFLELNDESYKTSMQEKFEKNLKGYLSMLLEKK